MVDPLNGLKSKGPPQSKQGGPIASLQGLCFESVEATGYIRGCLASLDGLFVQHPTPPKPLSQLCEEVPPVFFRVPPGFAGHRAPGQVP